MIKRRVPCPYCVPQSVKTVSGMTGHIKGKHPEKWEDWEKIKTEYINKNATNTGEKGFQVKEKKTEPKEPKEAPLKEPEKPPAPIEPKVEVPEPLPPKPEVKEGGKEPKAKSFLDELADALDDL